MNLKFLQLLDDLVMHISIKFHSIWFCTLGDIYFSLKGTKSARKVTFIGYIWSHFDWKVIKFESCLQVLEVPKLVLDWFRSMTSNEYKAIWLWNVLGVHIWYSNLKTRSNSKWRWSLSSSNDWRSFSRKKMT
jgi:hypothetical protein